MRRWFQFIAALAALVYAGDWAVSAARSTRSRSQVANMTKRTKTVCVGRYLVDVPAQAEVDLSGGVLDGFDIVTVEETETAFHERMAAREAEIRARPSDPATNTEGGMIEARDLRISGLGGRTFVYGRSRGYMMEGDRRVNLASVSVESHVHIKGVSFSLTATTASEARAKEIGALFSRIRLRGEDEVPTAQGFCIRRAVFADPLPAHRGEHIVMHLGLPEFPNLTVTLASIAGACTGGGLLARIARTDASVSPDVLLRMTKLRASKRSINGVGGEEVLFRARECNFTTTYGFSWEARGTTDDPLKPFLSLELRTGMSDRPGGKPVEASLHEDALLMLWDSIASSIRLRSGDIPATHLHDPEPAARQVSRTEY